MTIGTGGHQFSSQISFHRFIRIAFRAGDHGDTGVLQCRLRSAADAAADQDIDTFPCQKTGKCAMTGAVGADDLTGHHLIILYFIYLEILCSSKMLKHISIVVSYRNFHIHFLLSIIVAVLNHGSIDFEKTPLLFPSSQKMCYTFSNRSQKEIYHVHSNLLFIGNIGGRIS